MTTSNHSYPPPSQPVLSYPTSVMDIFFPGLTSIYAAFQEFQAGNSNSYVGMICTFGALILLGNYAYIYLREFVATYFTSRVHVTHSNEAREMLVAWIASQPFASNASSCLARVTTGRDFVNRYSDEHKQKILQYTPWNGRFSFRYKNRRLTFHCVETRGNAFSRDDIFISCVGKSPEILRELMSECRGYYLKLIKNKTSIFEHRDGEWITTRAIDNRHLDTVIFDEMKKKLLLEDIRSFLDPEARAWYSRRGIPYRRGYLLHGQPGTGKSSLSLSIAGSCDLDIYILNLSSVNDSSLGNLFTQLPSQCVILLEDVDCVNGAQSRQCGIMNVGSDMSSPSTKVLSLSAILNVLDGVGSQEGRVLIMTTNHPERIDPALTRPGRVDLELELGLADKDINNRLFCAIFMRDDTPTDGIPTEDGHTGYKTKLTKLATEFADRLPENEFSPAEIQLFLLEHRKSPEKAVENVQAWVVKRREARI